MDDLIAVWTIGRDTGRVDEDGKQLVRIESEVVRDMSMDGVLRRLRGHLIEDGVVAISLQLGDGITLEGGDLVRDLSV